jgi:hypothetical protein
MYIRYVGFNVAAGSRSYDFQVIATPREARKFTVNFQSEAFRAARLTLQDGPAICFARLERELLGKPQRARVGAHPSIGERDVDEYLQWRYPERPLREKRGKARGATAEPNDSPDS